jgi:hypothetical protein
MDHKQALELQLPTIERAIGAKLDVQQVQGVDLVGLAVTDMNEVGGGATKAQQVYSLIAAL